MVYVCGIVEVKTKKKFNNHAICQTIGYHIARRVATGTGMYSNIQTYIYMFSLICCTLSTLGEGEEQAEAPLAILFCGDEVRFIFFPFMENQSSCIDAIVTPAIVTPAIATPAIRLFKEDSCMINEEWFSFVCYYLENKFKILNPAEFSITAHPKKEFVRIMEEIPTVEELQVRKRTAICTGKKDHYVCATSRLCRRNLRRARQNLRRLLYCWER